MAEPVFFSPSREITVGEIAELTGATITDPSDKGRIVRGVAPADEGGEGTLVFVEGRKAPRLIGVVRAEALLCQEAMADKAPEGVAVLVTKTPHRAFARVMRELYPDAVRPAPMTGETGVSPHAHVHAGSAIEDGAIVEAGAVIGAGAEIGRGTLIAPNAVIGPGCRIGRDCYVGPNCGIRAALIGDRVLIHNGTQIGQDGYGYVPGDRGFDKIPQIGRVIIQDDVEIGANVTIDRGAMSDTVIGAGTKIDNLVQIGHNTRIGRLCLIVAQCGLSGTTTLGDFVTLGGQVGVGDHVTIGNGARIAAGSGVIGNVPPGTTWFGYPAQPGRAAMRQQALLRKMTKRASRKGDEHV